MVELFDWFKGLFRSAQAAPKPCAPCGGGAEASPAPRVPKAAPVDPAAAVPPVAPEAPKPMQEPHPLSGVLNAEFHLRGNRAGWLCSAPAARPAVDGLLNAERYGWKSFRDGLLNARCYAWAPPFRGVLNAEGYGWLSR